MSLQRRNLVLGTFLVGIIGAFAAFPFYMKASHAGKNLTHQESSLVGNSLIRGAYMNYGTKDVGADPDWDPRTNTYRGKMDRFNPSEEDIKEARKKLEARMQKLG